VADNDAAITAFNTTVTLTLLTNDITYGGTTLVPGSIDLDPATAGQQTSATVAGGTFTAQPDGSVVFTPTTGFAGQTSGSYTVQDSQGRTSNVATITVTVKPSSTGTLMLFSFEDGTDGWGPGSWQTNAGSVAQTSAFHTDGAYGLQINSTSGAWFGLDFPTPVDLTGKTQLRFDLQTGSAGTSMSVALKIGTSYQWCQTGWSWINPNTTTTIDVDLTQDLGCSQVDLSQIHGLYIWFSAGTFDIDAVRAE
jgi:mannan endo-1,4-beta-mannosidase